MRSFMIVLIAASACLGAPAHAQTAPDSENGRYCILHRAGWRAAARHPHRPGLAVRQAERRLGLQRGAGRAQWRWKTRSRGCSARTARSRRTCWRATCRCRRTSAALPQTGQRELQLKVPLPSDAEIDRVMSAFEKMWRRLVDIMQKTPGSDRI